MALIGTISGSNGTSTSSVTGSLVIADKPSLVTKPANTVLFVSGAESSGPDSPSVIFKADTFVSGAFGIDAYMQFKPVESHLIPTNTTASYIYVSGSTNDLYFAQYQPGSGLANNTRLRWLEGALTTGLLNGGIISTVAGTTTFSIAAGAGIIVSQNAAITSDPYPTTEYVSWPAFVSSSLLYSGSAQISYVSIESGGTLSQTTTPPTLAQYKDRILLGRVLHQTGSVSNGAVNTPAMAYAAASNTFDFIRPFGPLKVSGHLLAASGSTLGLTKTAGDSYTEGRNYSTDPNSPNTILAADDPALTNCKIYRTYVSGSTIIQDTGIANAGYAVIDPSKYVNGSGVLAAVGNSEWTNQRVFWFPKSVNRALYVYYGYAKYATLLEATAGLITEEFVEADNTKGTAIYVGSVSVKGNETNLSSTTNVKISQSGLFRGAGTGGGGGSTSPAGLTSYVQFNNAGAFGADANLTFNNTSHALYVGGDITGSNALLSGDIAVNGGDITSTAITFNVVNSTATTVNIGGAATSVSIGAASGRTTVYNDLAIATGNIIGAPGAGANVMTLLSSGNIVAKLDVDNNAAGHKFIVQDYTGASQFSVGENGNAELTGSLVVTGSITALAGFSGSLTRLANGSNYLLPGSNVSLSTGSSGAITINSSLPTGFLAQSFGGGYDGDVTVVDGAVLSLGNEVHYNNITIQGSGSIKPNGWRIFCKGTLTISASGSINDDGNTVSGATGGAAFAARGLIGGIATGGANGVATNTNGTNASITNNASRNDNGSYPSSAIGGSAGIRTGGTAATLTSAFGTQQAHSCWQTGRPIWNGNAAAATSNPFSSGVGGNSGGNDVGAAVTSGAGGGGGGTVWVCANTISNSGRISANGAPGGNATGVPGVGGGGGGGGGSGGIVTVITTTPVSLIGGSITANGGAGGNGIGTGTSGSAGMTGCRVIVSYGGN